MMGVKIIGYARFCGPRGLVRILKILFASGLESRIKCYTSICGLSHPLVLLVRACSRGVASLIDVHVWDSRARCLGTPGVERRPGSGVLGPWIEAMSMGQRHSPVPVLVEGATTPGTEVSRLRLLHP
jgi:hypothetical protein